MSNKLIIISFEFILIFYFLQAFGPVLDAALSNWTGILAPFGAIIHIFVPSPDKVLLTFIESLVSVGFLNKDI